MLVTIQRFRYDPLGFVMFSFPWGVAGSALEAEPGPDHWQVETLDAIGSALAEQADAPADLKRAVQVAVGSGHGIGKSTLLAWIVLWWMATRWESSNVITANTATQLSTKTWRELRRWAALCRLSDWFDVQATSIKLKWAESCQTDAIPWSKDKPEAVAGTHAPHVLLGFDESSSIADVIWETVEGAGLTGEKLWLALGNRTRNTGRFNDSFGKQAHRWITSTVCSLDARKTKKAEIQAWIDDWGWDSDFVKVRVRGLPPAQASTQLIPIDLIQRARKAKPKVLEHLPQVMGVDVARFGDNKSVIYRRTGLASLSIERFAWLDEVKLADEVAERIDTYEPDAVFIDGHGIGGGVISILKHRGFDVISATVGDAARIPAHANKRTDCYVDLRQWLRDGAGLPDEDWLEEELVSIEYGFSPRTEKMQIVPKEVMRSLGIPSPDGSDAIMLTFYAPVHKRSDKRIYRPVRATAASDWDVMGLN
ncbi:MAG: terminase [Geminicoccaceae bacterium]